MARVEVAFGPNIREMDVNKITPIEKICAEVQPNQIINWTYHGNPEGLGIVCDYELKGVSPAIAVKLAVKINELPGYYAKFFDD